MYAALGEEGVLAVPIGAGLQHQDVGEEHPLISFRAVWWQGLWGGQGGGGIG